MMYHVDMNDDMLSLSMFWAGALMVFTPLVCAAVVLGVWWRQRGRARSRSTTSGEPRPADVSPTLMSPR